MRLEYLERKIADSVNRRGRPSAVYISRDDWHRARCEADRLCVFPLDPENKAEYPARLTLLGIPIRKHWDIADGTVEVAYA